MTAADQAGRWVAALRLGTRRTQQQLAEELTAHLGKHVAALTVTRIENNKRPTSVDEIAALAAIFGVDVGLMFTSPPKEKP